MNLRPRGFRARLMITLMLLMLTVLIATAVAVLQQTYRDTMAQAQAQLQRGEQILREVMQNRTTQLSTSVSVLAADFGLRAAVAAGDRETLESALANHGDRIQADMVILADLQGRIEVSTHHRPASAFPYPHLLEDARRNGLGTAVVLQDDAAYHLVLVPVRAPQIVAWVGMGFALDQRVAHSIASLSGLDVVFAGYPPRSTEPHFSTGTLSTDANATLVSTLLEASVAEADDIIDSPEALFLQQRLSTPEAARVKALLVLTKQQVLDNYRVLQFDLLVLFGIALFGSAIAAIGLARSAGKPLLRLALLADDISRGEYRELTDINDKGEIGVLARTLQSMQREVRRREERIRYQALHDPLTGLPNRMAMDEHLQRLLADPHPRLVLRLSIREFKEINDTLGYRFGDEALQSIAARLRLQAGGQGRIARIGGNEFVIVMDRGNDALAHIEALRTRIEHPVMLMDAPITLTLEVGGLRLPEDAADLTTLWRRSAIVLSASRRMGGKTFLYTPGLDESHLRELTITRELLPALDAGQFSMRYQPKLRLKDRQIAQFEALIRWQHPQLGFIPPDEFIQLAERSSQVGRLTHWVLCTVIEQVSAWRHAGLDVGVAVNLSAHDLLDQGLPDRLADLLIHWPGPRSALTLEVTESALMRDPDIAVRVLNELKALGVHIAIDDFGTGYSSLAQLKQLPVDELKIDKSFVLRLDQEPEDQLIVRSTIELGHNLGLEIVAEGVETAEGWILLEEYGCDNLQGYFIARPLSPAEVHEWLAAFDARRDTLPTQTDNRDRAPHVSS